VAVTVQNSVAERRNERLKLDNDSLQQQVASVESRLLETQQQLETTVVDLQTKVILASFCFSNAIFMM